jgi:hypothetical protein
LSRIQENKRSLVGRVAPVIAIVVILMTAFTVYASSSQGGTGTFTTGSCIIEEGVNSPTATISSNANYLLTQGSPFNLTGKPHECFGIDVSVTGQTTTMTKYGTVTKTTSVTETESGVVTTTATSTITVTTNGSVTSTTFTTVTQVVEQTQYQCFVLGVICVRG